MPNITGSCHCGKVQYSCSSDPIFSAICHCSSCQKLSGTAFITIIGLNKNEFNVTGKENLTKYVYTGDSGKPANRYFCNSCGSLIYGESTSRPDAINLTIGTLDDKSWIKPQMQVYWRDHVSFIQEMKDIPAFEIMPQKK